MTEVGDNFCDRQLIQCILITNFMERGNTFNRNYLIIYIYDKYFNKITRST